MHRHALAGLFFSNSWVIWDLPYKKQLFGLLMATMMIPGMMYMVPQFFMVCSMGLFGTKLAMILPHLASVFGIFMLNSSWRRSPAR